jgi:hypothetical protein
MEEQESILPNFNFFASLLFTFKLGHFKIQTMKNGKIFILRTKKFGRIDSRGENGV